MHNCNIDEKLNKHGLRKTKDRHKILELFHEDRTWTASQLHKAMNVDLSTVYRNVQTLLDAGLVKKVHSHDGEQQYEYIKNGHHDHLACPKCSITRCIPCPAPKLDNHHIELIKTCSICKKTA